MAGLVYHVKFLNDENMVWFQNTISLKYVLDFIVNSKKEYESE